MKKREVGPLYQELDIHRQERGSTWAQVAAQSGISSTARIRMEQGAKPSAEDMAKLRAWLWA